jgi:large subunit ribosomal protein L17
MRHQKAGRKLGRNAAHRRALMRNLAWALFQHERVVTTVAKAKEVRRFVERIITIARKDTLHARRLVLARMGGKKTRLGSAKGWPRNRAGPVPEAVP